jgi:DNA-directed RNA polymerase subunit RPC12/RpoP
MSWICLGCGAEFQDPPQRCPKCGCPFFAEVREAEGKNEE